MDEHVNHVRSLGPYKTTTTTTTGTSGGQKNNWLNEQNNNQLCMCITLFCTFLCLQRTTTT